MVGFSFGDFSKNIVISRFHDHNITPRVIEHTHTINCKTTIQYYMYMYTQLLNAVYHIAILARVRKELKEENAELELQRNYTEVKKRLWLSYGIGNVNFDLILPVMHCACSEQV